MKTLNEIIEKYPSIDVNQSGGPDTFDENAPIVERDPIAVIIIHPTEDMYLLAEWKSSNWRGFLTGGIEDGDTLEDTVRKEVKEETGYIHIKEIIKTDIVSHGLFFHTVKRVNRLAHYHLVIAKLQDLEQVEISDEEKSIAEFVWYKKEDILNLLTRNDMKILWNHFLEHSI